MKKNIQKVNAFCKPSENGSWWNWQTYCDKCGKYVGGKNTLNGFKPNTDEVDYCLSCLRNEIDSMNNE